MHIFSTVEIILNFICNIQTSLNCVYNVLLTIGHVIVLIVIKILRLLKSISTASGEVFKILKEDFEIFQHDLLVLFTPALKWLKDSTTNVFTCIEALYLFLLSVCEGFSTCVKNVLDSYQYIYWFVYKILVLFLDSLCLIGNTFMYCCNSTVSLLSLDTLSHLSHIGSSYFGHIIKLEAVFGLMILTFLSVISIKCRIHLKIVHMINICFLEFVISSQQGFKLFLMMIPLFVSAIKRNWNSVKHKLFKHVRKKEELSKLSTDDLQRLLEEEKAEKLCIICMDRKRNIILLHCQHLILCNICVSTILEDSALCPVCRRVIFDVITVYT